MPEPAIAALPDEDRISLPPDLLERHNLALTVPCPDCRALPRQHCHRADRSRAQRVQLRLLHQCRHLLADRAAATVSAATRIDTRPRVNSAARPLLYLDLDGPMCLWAAPQPTSRAPRSRRARTPRDQKSRRTPMQGRLTPSNGHQLFALTEIYDLVWASQPSDHTTRVGSLLGLPQLPALRWDFASGDPLAKARALVDHARDRPFVWVDSSIDHAACIYVHRRHRGPVYLYRIDPRHGLRTSDFITLHAAAGTLAVEQRPDDWPNEPLLAPLSPAADRQGPKRRYDGAIGETTQTTPAEVTGPDIEVPQTPGIRCARRRGPMAESWQRSTPW